ncbi:alpha-L-Rha alpha-1,3-L-rhamnosyltransferase [Streptococcus danieliae]|uniref:Alpha-L-Rha alpha-1,3-L-rhamnosyltransferase n=1 Tax=Streptococcus danieliae TaxID=747656 RepID=A0A7Z0LCD6_9STRE|nr:rhamnan synthesis F family protein [Streptococcus danieliae]MBF0716938.1 alpha-L-Rha alpha-1,3-L-rhamnosyltransferase [Streptococcus danieliae]NYS48868.1 alpha-L-Rha alpha-1,3-L-rhamnosyltransferase [Streptococcus danieliae]
MKRLLIYVHYNKNQEVSPHVLYQLKKMRPLFSQVLVVSNSPLPEQGLQDLKGQALVDQVWERANSGFDFAAWRDAMKNLGWSKLEEFDSLTLMNDTCFGPIWDFTPHFLGMEADEQIDFWGLTNFRATKEFPEHLQSYFLTFKKSILQDQSFFDFWQNVQDYENVQDVINHYESGVTTYFLERGFQYKALFDTTQEATEGMLHPDFTYYNPRRILEVGLPFLKVKALDANQSIAPYLLDTIQTQSDYPIDLIVYHMSMVNQPDSPYLLGQKYLSNLREFRPLKGSVAIHLHVFYTDLLPEFLTVFEQFPFAFDLFLTTDTEAKKAEILEKTGQQDNQEVFVTGNRGRDLFPMLLLKERLAGYDYVGHFHTKKSKEADFWAGESWRRELIQMLVEPSAAILTQFEEQPNIGLVIADIPSFFRYNRIVTAWNEHQMAAAMNQLWEDMGLSKIIDFAGMDTFVMSYGSFAWFRYEALKPLFDLDLQAEAIPEEPLPQNSILHAMERLLVYIAWNQGYDFRISPSPRILTPFVDNKLLNLNGDLHPPTYIDFNYMGGIKGAFKYIVLGPARAIKYILKRLVAKYS